MEEVAHGHVLMTSEGTTLGDADHVGIQFTFHVLFSGGYIGG